MASFKWEDAPASGFNVEEKEYPMVITSAKKIVLEKSGYVAIQLTWESLDASAKFKLNYDNYIYGTTEKEFDFNYKAVSFGFAKLKAVNEATVNLPDCDPDILVKVLPTKKAIVKVKMGTSNFPEVDGTNIRKYEPETLNTTEIPTSASNTPAPEAFDLTGEEDPFKL